MNLQNVITEKFSDTHTTVKGETRAWVSPVSLNTLWINTGTLCNLECKNCYIESSPKNDRLEYISLKEVLTYLEEIQLEGFDTQQIAFTGGEPFMNPSFIAMVSACLQKNFSVLILTNAMTPMKKRAEELLSLKNKYKEKLSIRVSLDHYTEELHSEQRGRKSWNGTLEGLRWLFLNEFNFSVAGRSLWNESDQLARQGFQSLFDNMGIKINCSDPALLILFPEMSEEKEVPEITTACWDILKKNPNDIMCATSRMVIKRKGQPATVSACTLLPYSQEFEFGETLKSSWKNIYLNHKYCAQFCVLGGGSCTT
ncbi:MAG: radical SAM protein [Bdellovibrionales bacterium]|nr:radical SAM protein [Bdellovibrionales bacterium]